MIKDDSTVLNTVEVLVQMGMWLTYAAGFVASVVANIVQGGKPCTTMTMPASFDIAKHGFPGEFFLSRSALSSKMECSRVDIRN